MTPKSMANLKSKCDLCLKGIKTGSICCFNCSKLFHTRCVVPPTPTLRQSNSLSEAVWFCQICKTIPIVNCLTVLMKKCEKLTEAIEQLISTRTTPLDVNEATPESKGITTNSPHRPKKRARRPCLTSVSQAPVALTHSTFARGLIANSMTASNPMHSPAFSNSVAIRETQSCGQPTSKNDWASHVSAASRERTEDSPVTPITGLCKNMVSQQESPSLASTTSPTAKVTSAIKPILSRRNYSALNLVCTNVPESKSTTIQGKLIDDRSQWDSICTALGIRTDPTMLKRIARHPNSVHYGEPRLLRVTLNSADETETVLLSANRLSKTSSEVRILPDVPWKERSKDGSIQEGNKKHHDKRVVIVHGVPEHQAPCSDEAQAHDRDQWRYIREALSLENLVATSLTRIPMSPNYKGSGPRLLKLVLQSETAAQSMLENWAKFRDRLPTEIRLKAVLSQPKFTSNSLGAEYPMQIPIAKSSAATDVAVIKSGWKLRDTSDHQDPEYQQLKCTPTPPTAPTTPQKNV